MDPDSPISRAERTFWTFWNYISEAVSRFLRPEPPVTERNDVNTDTQDASVTNELLDSGHTNHGTTEKHFTPASSLCSSQPVVSWDTQSPEAETQNMQHISEDEKDKTYKESEGMREEQAEDEEGEQDDAKDVSLGTMTKKRLSIEGESCMEKLSFSFTVKHEGGSGQEEAKAFKNIPPSECEGQGLVPQELYSTYKETQEGVPEHNNEAECDGSATQRFLEVGNCREVHTTLLQEEVEIGATECLQNSSSKAGTGSFTAAEHMEKEALENSLTENKTTLTELGIEKSGPDNFMKTGAEYKQFEADVVSQDETHEKRDDLKEDAKELLVEFEMSESLCEVEAACDGKERKDTGIDGLDNETEFQNMNEALLLHQSTDDNDSCTSSQKKTLEVEAESLVKMQCTGLELKDVEEDLCRLEDTTEGKTISERNMEIKTVPGQDESLDYEMLTSIESAEESIKGVYEGKDTQYMLAEWPEPQSNDVIEDELLDLWIQQTSMENTDVTQQGSTAQDDMLSVNPEKKKVESDLGELSLESEVNVSSSTAESGFFDQSLDMWDCKKEQQESPKTEQLTDVSYRLSNISESEDASEVSVAQSELDTSPESTDDEAQTLQNTDDKVCTSGKFAAETDDEPLKKMRALFKEEAMANVQSTSSNEIKNTVLMPEGFMYECQQQEKQNCQWSEEELLPGFERKEDSDIDEIDASELDFAAQKSRIAVKNPRVRPPKDPRALLQKPSLEPSPSKQLPKNIPAGVPVGGLGIGVKLPGLGEGFPVLKKTKRTVQEHTTETSSQEVKPDDNDYTHKQVDSQHKPKWMPPKHPGFGNPLMSELKTKLKKTAKE